ncbi:MAG: Gfo/Idh/MocA family oxidoreductase [Terracidiphilus sp.]
MARMTIDERCMGAKESMRVGVIGTGAIAWKQAQAYKNIGYKITACTDRTETKGRNFADAIGAEFVPTPEELARRADVDYLDVCTFPGYRLEAVELAAKYGKHVLVQKPMAVDLGTAARMIQVARAARIQLGVVSQHRFDDSTLFLKRAIAAGRLGTILQADAYVKWHRSDEYYARPVKGSWAGEGGGALISQAIHQVDVLLHLMGAVDEVFGYWQLGATHKIESEDLVCAVMHYASGATGVIQAATALWPGYPERIEIHGTKGSAIVTGDQLTSWDVQDDQGEAAPISQQSKSGASDPMAISLTPFERQFAEFGEACNAGRASASSGMDGYRALQLVRSIYDSCREGKKVQIPAAEI